MLHTLHRLSSQASKQQHRHSMVQYIDFRGESVPVDFSIRTLSTLAKAYGVDITGLAEIVASKADDIDDSLELIERLGVVALNDGAERCGLERRYTKFDIRDAIITDASLGEQLLTMMASTFEQTSVFPTAPQPTAPQKKKKK